MVTATLIVAQLSLHITEISLQTFPLLPHHFADLLSDLSSPVSLDSPVESTGLTIYNEHSHSTYFKLHSLFPLKAGGLTITPNLPMKLEPVWRVVRLEVPVAAKGCFLYTRLCLSVTPVAVVGCVCTESGLSGYLDFHLNFREHHSFKCNTVAGADLSNPLLPRCTVEFSRMPCVIQRATRKQLVIQ